MAIVWHCALDVKGYVAAGADLEVPRTRCPDCRQPMIWWSRYGRYVREGVVRKMQIRRAKCVPCARTHALLPAFLLLRRLDPVAVIGEALASAVRGVGARAVATRLDVPHSTARDWSRRHQRRAGMLSAGFSAVAVDLGGAHVPLPADAAQASLTAMGAAWQQAQQRFGATVVELWRFVSAVTGGELLGTTTSPPWAGVGGRRFMPPTPPSPQPRSPPCPPTTPKPPPSSATRSLRQRSIRG